MNRERLTARLRDYRGGLNGEQWKADERDRRERIAYYAAFDEAAVKSMEEDEFTEFIGRLWASGMYGNKKYLADKIIEANGGMRALASQLAYFLYGRDPLDKRWDRFLAEAKLFGPSYMSELLCCVYPEDCALVNRQVVKALEALEVPSVPHYNYQFTGKTYLGLCKAVKEIREAMRDNGLPSDNLLDVNYFLWFVAMNAPSAEREPEIAPQAKDVDFVHREIIDKVVGIGTMLGFDAKSEVKVASGAVVDAIWSVNIGNMGRVIYVFEVQSKGSIDSLILNLQKAMNNNAVQATVAVSDSRQLEKIRREVESLKKQNLDIRLWDYHNVVEVFDALSKSFDAINKLGLVPSGFGY